MAAVTEVTVIVELASIEEVVALSSQFGAGRLVAALPALWVLLIAGGLGFIAWLMLLPLRLPRQD